MPVEVALRGEDIDPKLIDTLDICWKVKVEYLVNTAKAPQRSRKGLDPSGAGKGADGFLIPGPTVEECTVNKGPKYEISWGKNFGGGLLQITAKTTIDGVEISDTYEGKIEGERTDDQFKAYMIEYLKDKGKTFETELGSKDILFALACIETSMNHFYPPAGNVVGIPDGSQYGVPKGANYPLENTGGDGGFGLMQLTFWGTAKDLKLPTYKQIWHWKENIDASIDVVKGKIAMAKRQSSNFTKDQLRMNVYSLFRGGYYWKWTKDIKTKKYNWIPRYNKDSDNQEEINNYKNSGVIEADKAVNNEGKDSCQ